MNTMNSPENDQHYLGGLECPGLRTREKRKQNRLMKMALGIFDVRPGYGYHKDWTINETEAKWVRRVFELKGRSYSAQKAADIVSKESGEKWSSSRVRTMIHNEIYTGDIHVNKMVTSKDGRRVKNNGIEPQYYQKEHHAPIIDRRDFERLQRKEMEK